MCDMRVIYNDSCPICSREVSVYRRDAEAEGLDVTFNGLSPDELAGTGLSRDTAARKFHVITGDELHEGVDAFVVLWQVLPRWAWLARIVGHPMVRPVARLVYDRILAPVLFAMDRRRQSRIP